MRAEQAAMPRRSLGCRGVVVVAIWVHCLLSEENDAVKVFAARSRRRKQGSRRRPWVTGGAARFEAAISVESAPVGGCASGHYDVPAVAGFACALDEECDLRCIGACRFAHEEAELAMLGADLRDVPDGDGTVAVEGDGEEVELVMGAADVGAAGFEGEGAAIELGVSGENDVADVVLGPGGGESVQRLVSRASALSPRGLVAEAT